MMAAVLQEEDKLMEIVQLVGSDALPEREQLTLEVARLMREFVLQQNAFHEVDSFCELEKSYLLMKTISHYRNMATQALEAGIRVHDIINVQAKNKIGEVRFDKDHKKILGEITKEIDQEFAKLKAGK